MVYFIGEIVNSYCYMGGFTLNNVGEFRDTFYFLSDTLNQNDLLYYCSDSNSSYFHRLQNFKTIP